MMRPLGSRGIVVMEVIAGIGLLGAMTLMLAVIFKLVTVSSTRSRREMELLTNARQALSGEASFRGLARDIEYAQAITTAAISSLSVEDASNAVTTYTVTGDQLRSTKSGVTTTRARGLDSLSFNYYGLAPDYTVYLATNPAEARLVTVSMSMKSLSKTVYFYSGGRLRNDR